jgi:hypothetical protein
MHFEPNRKFPCERTYRNCLTKWQLQSVKPGLDWEQVRVHIQLAFERRVSEWSIWPNYRSFWFGRGPPSFRLEGMGGDQGHCKVLLKSARYGDGESPNVL